MFPHNQPSLVWCTFLYPHVRGVNSKLAHLRTAYLACCKIRLVLAAVKLVLKILKKYACAVKNKKKLTVISVWPSIIGIRSAIISIRSGIFCVRSTIFTVRRPWIVRSSSIISVRSSIISVWSAIISVWSAVISVWSAIICVGSPIYRVPSMTYHIEQSKRCWHWETDKTKSSHTMQDRNCQYWETYSPCTNPVNYVLSH